MTPATEHPYSPASLDHPAHLATRLVAAHFQSESPSSRSHEGHEEVLLEERHRDLRAFVVKVSK
jgi:hypothetical protein